MDDLRAAMVLDGKVVNDRWIIEKFSFDAKPKTFKLWASDLFNGNAVISEYLSENNMYYI